MAGTIFLRFLQLACLGGVALGVLQAGPLSSEIGLAFKGEPGPIGPVAGKVAIVTGPVVISLILMFVLELTIRNMGQERKLKAAHPSQPWLWKPQWAAKHMRLSNKPLLIGWFIFFLIYFFVGVPLALFSEKQPLIILALVVGLLTLLVLRMIWNSRNWNRAELRIATLPGVIGGPFSGALILKQTFPADTVFDVNLKCASSRTERHGKKSEIRHTDLWSSTLYVQRPLKGSPKGTTALPVNFAIPYSALPTGAHDDETVRWVLSVQKKEEVSTGGASFEIPVFRTADSRQNYQLDASLMKEHLAVFDPAAVLKRFGFKTQQLSSTHVRYNFREFDTSIFVTLVVMSLILIGIMVPLWFWVKQGREFAMAFPGIFVLMFLYGIVHMLFWRLRIDRFTTGSPEQLDTLAELAVPVKENNTIVAESGILGLRKSIRVIADRTTVLRCKIDHRANNQESWSIWLCDAQGQKLKILSAFRGASEAHAAAKFLGEKLGISAGGIKADDGFL